MRTRPASLAIALLTALAAPAALAATGDDPSLPDLVPGAFSWSPESPTEGETVAFEATVRNDGTADARLFEVALVVDGDRLGRAVVTSLAAGGSLEVVLPPWTAEVGPHEVTLVVDVGGAVVEVHEDNNNDTRELVVGPRPAPSPDLVVIILGLTPGDPRANDTVIFHAEVRNTGDAAAPPSTLRFRLDGEDHSRAAVGALAPGATVRVTSSSWEATMGNHTLAAEADAGEVVPEGDETNNVREREFVVVARPPEPPVQPPPTPPSPEDHHEDDANEGKDGNATEAKVTLCHTPPGNPAAAHNITVGESAVEVHLAHGDHRGPCTGREAAGEPPREHDDQGPGGSGDERPGRRVGQSEAEHGNSAAARAEHPPARALAEHGREAAEAVGNAGVQAMSFVGGTVGTPLGAIALVGCLGASAAFVAWRRR